MILDVDLHITHAEVTWHYYPNTVADAIAFLETGLPTAMNPDVMVTRSDQLPRFLLPAESYVGCRSTLDPFTSVHHLHSKLMYWNPRTIAH